MAYIRFPIETDPETLAQDVYDYITTFYPGWVPQDGNLDTMIIRGLAFKAAENRDLASDVQDSIFRSFGATLMAIPPLDSVAAIGSTTWTMIDNLGHTIPAGTQVALTGADGQVYPFFTIADVIVPAGNLVTAVGEVTIQALNEGTDSNNLGGTVNLIDVRDYIQSVAIVGTTAGGVDAEADGDYLDRLVRRLQLLSQVPILPADFAQATLDASTEADRAVALDGYNPTHNLLTLNQASAETDASGWVSGVSSSAQAADGAKSISMSNPAGGDLTNTLFNHPASDIAVSAGDSITVLASFRANTTARSCKVGIAWYDIGGALIGGVVNYGAGVNDSNAAWTQVSYTAVAPQSAVKATIYVTILATAANEIHYIDKMSFRRGITIDWVPGGTIEWGNDRTITVVAVNSLGNPVSAGAKTDIINYLAARREVNFVIHVADAKYTNIDAHADIKVAAGYDSATVTASVVTAITNYLSPANWGLGTSAHTWIDTGKVYYNELITIVGNTLGVDRVSDLTINIHGFTATRADLVIASPAGLTTPGTITATAV